MATPSNLVEQALREISVPTPRPLRLRPLNQVKGFWRLVFGLAALVLLSPIFLWGLYVPVLARHFGTPIQAVIENRRVENGRHPLYFADVVFQEGDVMNSREVDVDYQVYLGLSVGQKVGIHYFPFFPKVASLDLSPADPSGIFFLLGVPFLIILLNFAGKSAWLPLLKQGKAVKGRVIQVDSGNIKVQFKDFDKEYTFDGPGYCYERYQEMNDEVAVLFKPENPELAKLYDPTNSLWVPAAD